MAGFVCFQLGLGVCLQVEMFPVAMNAGIVVFLPAWFWDVALPRCLHRRCDFGRMLQRDCPAALKAAPLPGAAVDSMQRVGSVVALFQRAHQQSALAGQHVSNVLAAALLFFLVYDNMAGMSLITTPWLPSSVHAGFDTIHMRQNLTWSMFSNQIDHYDHWWEFRDMRGGSDPIDLMHDKRIGGSCPGHFQARACANATPGRALPRLIQLTRSSVINFC